MSQLAYLVIRDGPKWTDVFRLVPGQTAVIGRAPTSQIVIKDERCSRSHAELFVSDDQWTIRDLDSRNGTLVGNKRIQADLTLHPGDIVRIGRSQLVFVYHLTEAFSDTSSIVRRSNIAKEETGTASKDQQKDGANVLGDYQPTTITHRRGQTKFLKPGPQDESAVSKAGQAAAALCRLAFELAKAPNVSNMAEQALAGLFENTATDTGAILLLPREENGGPDGAKLEVIASKSTANQRYHRVSNFLASTVMHEEEAVLARNVMGDSTLGSRDSDGEITATSVICAPIRSGKKLLGLVHLYSTDTLHVPDSEDLEFTLAVADTVAVAIANLNRHKELAEHLTQIRNENVQLRERLGVQSEIVGDSPPMKLITEEIARAAASNATVLVRGESGVGKELVARAIHYSSPRSDNVFVCLNCAALSESLLASELFGHERGAFTGATERKLGKFEAADGGTLMLDEIGDMSPGIQAKFLRVLEGHPFERVGGNKPVTANVRVIAATNRNLEKAVAEGSFRRDLYFRLHVLEIVVPSLRKRMEDVTELAHYFLEKFRDETGRKIDGFTPPAMDRLLGYRWPGNVRELKNVIERAVVICRGTSIEQDEILLSTLPTSGDTVEIQGLPEAQFKPTSLADIERQHIRDTLAHTNWNKSRTANILGIERSTLDRKIRRYDLTRIIRDVVR